MAVGGVEVDLEGVEVDRELADGLGAVKQDDEAGGAGEGAYFGGRHPDAVVTLHMAEGDHAGAGGDAVLDVLEGFGRIMAAFEPAEADAAAVLLIGPGEVHGGVLGEGDKDLVVGLKTERGCDPVDGFGGVDGEADFVGVGAEKGRESFAGGLDLLFLRLVTAVPVTLCETGVFEESVNDGLGDNAGGAGVEVGHVGEGGAFASGEVDIDGVGTGGQIGPPWDA